jgi:Protein of unknown function (DUF1572)
MSATGTIFLQSALKRLGYYKDLGDKTLTVLSDADFHYQPNEESNSIAIIIQHVSGNMISRWTDFLTTDGEKEWRNRDLEFEITKVAKEQLIAMWEKGWSACLGTINALTEDDLLKTIYIRQEALSVIDAINRQLAHYPYHVGQIIYVAKMIRNEKWESLSIPRNKSQQFNEAMNSQSKTN